MIINPIKTILKDIKSGNRINQTGKNKMEIVYCTDNKYALYTRKSIEKILKYNPEAHITVCHFENEHPAIQDDKRISQFTFKKDMIYRHKENDRITDTTFLKLYLTDLPYDKIIYLDGDTICQYPLNDLWNEKVDYIGLTETHYKAQLEEFGRYGLTGLMVMNLKNLREINFKQRCLESIKTLPTPKTGWFHEETIINTVFHDKLTFLNQRYHYVHKRPYANPINENDVDVLHIAGADKSIMTKLTNYDNLKLIKEDIKGKRVAIVGNAQSLFDSNFGKEIDEHDFIIRFNKGFITNLKAQGTKTSLACFAVTLPLSEIQKYHAKWYMDRSNAYHNQVPYQISHTDRMPLKEKLNGTHPSSGFLLLDFCLASGAKSIDLYGFDFEKTPTFYNPVGYKTPHNYSREEEVVKRYEKDNLIRIH